MIYHLSFQKIYRGYHPRILTAGGVERVQNVCKCKRPGVRNQTLVPLNFSAVVAPLVSRAKLQSFDSLWNYKPQ